MTDPPTTKVEGLVRSSTVLSGHSVTAYVHSKPPVRGDVALGRSRRRPARCRSVGQAPAIRQPTGPRGQPLGASQPPADDRVRPPGQLVDDRAAALQDVDNQVFDAHGRVPLQDRHPLVGAAWISARVLA